MADLTRQTTVDKAKGLTPVIEMDERVASPTDSSSSTHNSKPIKPLQRAKTVHLSADEYFSGPRDVTHHSRWPTIFQLHGSVMPSMILPIFLVGLYSTFFTVIITKQNKKQGRKYWSQMTGLSQNLARIFWINAREREAINLICAFSLAVKHRLRFEPYLDYEDLRPYAGHLKTFAKDASEGVDLRPREYSKKKQIGEFLGFSFARSNPRKLIKRTPKPLGNLPLEILAHLQAYLDTIIDNGTLKAPCFQMQAIIALQNFNDILNGTDRILNTPLPAAYRIMITQITWIYIITLPPQLYKALKWFTIPATIIAAYIIIGIAFIGAEIENPFGYDVNDLPLDAFCEQIQDDLALIMSKRKVTKEDLYKQSDNMVLYPVSHAGYDEWVKRDEGDIREALASRPEYNFNRRRKAPVGMVAVDAEKEDV
ncbi:Bestrophin RFP-TM chloride channel-domain-containing protein [Venturia nashicola]|nr:Bestrophin RFP-TM chloride channel-domain-containing protein [Venturia nashicola]